MWWETEKQLSTMDFFNFDLRFDLKKTKKQDM